MSQPWYKQPHMWLVVAIPVAAVVLSFMYLGLALNGADTTVRDDWYMDGKALKQDLSRDVLSADRGLKATLTTSDSQLSVVLEQSDSALHENQLNVSFSHATKADYDFEVTALAVPSDPLRYEAELSTEQIRRLGTPGRYYVEVSGVDWRLKTKVQTPLESKLELEPLAIYLNQ